MALRNRDRRPEEETPEPVDTRMLERLAQLERWMDSPAGKNEGEDADMQTSESAEEPAPSQTTESVLEAAPTLATEPVAEDEPKQASEPVAEDASKQVSKPVAKHAPKKEPARADKKGTSHVVERVPKPEDRKAGRKSGGTGVLVLPGRRAQQSIPSLRAVTATPNPERRSAPIAAQLVVEQSPPSESESRHPTVKPARAVEQTSRSEVESNHLTVRPARAVVRASHEVTQTILTSRLAGTAAEREAPRRLPQC